jgi:hypothetical protein
MLRFQKLDEKKQFRKGTFVPKAEFIGKIRRLDTVDDRDRFETTGQR